MRITISITSVILISLLFIFKDIQGQQITRLTSCEFYQQYNAQLRDSSLLIIDGRTAEMFSAGHIVNAVNIDADMDGLAERLMEYSCHSLIVVYCTTDRRTGKIVNTLGEFYRGEIIFITDGITGWKENGGCVVF